MNFIDKMVERFIKLNRRMKRWQRVVSVMAAVVVFATTYALVLPAITLDKDTATTQAGIEIAASENESDEAGTVFESEQEDAVAEEEPEEAEEPAAEEEPEEAVVEEPAKDEDSSSESDSQDAETVEAEADETEAAEAEAVDEADASKTEPAAEIEQTDAQTGEEAAANGTTEEAIAAVTGQTAEEVKLITEDTQLSYEGSDYFVYADFGESAKLPEGVQLRAKEITRESDPEAYEAYYQKALSEMQDKYDENTKLSFAKFYDIAFVYDGVEIEPSGNVNVRIEYKQAVEIEKTTTVDTIHFDKNDEEKAEVINSDTEGTEKEVEAVEFESDRFSVYGIVGASISTEITLPGSDDIYEVTVAYGADAKIPENVHLSVSALAPDSNEYKEAKEAVIADKKAKDEKFDEKTLGFAALDISIVDESGAKVEPADGAEVKVSIKLKKLPEGTDQEALNNTLEVLHLNESTGTIVVETVAEAKDVTVEAGSATAEFTISSFSTFPLTWGDNSATIHYGELVNGEFTEFEQDKVAILDTTAASVSLENNFDGYSCYGAYYKETADAENSYNIELVLHRTENGWSMNRLLADEHGIVSSIEAPVENGSHIYVVYGAKQSHGSSAGDPTVHGPTTEKEVIDNHDGTFTVQLDVTAPVIEEVDKVGANVIVVLDTTRSMSYGMSSDSAPADWHDNRMEAARGALVTLVNTLNMNVNDVNFALAEFNLSGDTHTWGQSDWTKNPQTILNYVSDRGQLNYTTSSSGTNWEIGLRQGQGLLTQAETDAELKKNKTYVIFVTDGQPNRWVGYPARWNNDYTHITEAVTYAQDEANDVASRSSFYGVFCGSSNGFANLQTLVNTAGGRQVIDAKSSEAIRSAFEQIAHTIVSELGSSNVSVDDGVTSLSSVSARTVGTTSGYEYFKKGKNDTEFTKWEEAPGASYSHDNGVTWDLSDVGVLEDETTYRIRFVVWPSQQAYDIIANLNNGTVNYDDLDPEIQAQISGDATSGYTLKTNTHLSTTYSYNGETYTDPVTPLVSGDMPLESERMIVRKAFSHDINSQDPFESIIFYLKEDGKYYQKDGTTSATFDEDKVFELPVNTGNNWQNSIFIAPGFMEDEEVLETGHKYTLEEKVIVGSEYEYEFTPQTVRPMVINGTLTYLTLVDDYNGPGKNGVPGDVKTYTIDGETYYVSAVSNGELVGTNRKTAELDITKVVETNGILSDEEEAEETFTYRVTLEIPDGTDPAGIVGYEYVYRPEQGNAYYLYGYHQYEEGTPVASAFEDDIARLGNNKYRAWNTLVYRDLVEWETVDGKIVSKRDADGNIIWKVPASGGYHTIAYDMTLKQNEVIRFTNLPTGTKYTIQEIYANKYPADNVGGDTSGKTPVSDPSNIAAEGYEISIRSTAGTVSGDTVSGTIEGLDTRFYNQFTNTMTKTVDVNLAGTKKLEGYDWSGESYHFTLATTGGNPMPAEATGKTEFDLTAESGNADQTDVFGRIRFTAEGTYTYTVSETNAGELQVVNGKVVQFGDAVTVTFEIEEDETTHNLSVKSVTGTGVSWDEETSTATATITNTAPTTTVSANKAWLNADGTTEAPAGAKVTFTLYKDGVITSPAETVELDGTEDESGETTEWIATFSNLQKYKIVNNEPVEIVYTIFEEDSGKWIGYDRVNTTPVANGGIITNQQQTKWVQFKKTDMSGDVEGHRLEGAVFTFNDGIKDITITSGSDGIMATTPAEGETSVNKFELALRDGAYVLTEIDAPDGYYKLTDVVNVTVKTTGVSAQLGNTTTTYNVTGNGTEDDPYVVVITNSSGVELPNAGGPGTLLYTLGGLMLIMASALMYGFRMRRGERRIN